MGESIGQAFSFVATGNAELGLVALSHIYENNRISWCSGWIVPTHMHHALRQDAVLLMRGADNPAASALLADQNAAGPVAGAHAPGSRGPSAPWWPCPLCCRPRCSAFIC